MTAAVVAAELASDLEPYQAKALSCRAMLRFAPEYRSLPWGGRRFADEFDREIPEGPIGESWELVELDAHHSAVASGPHQGEKLGDLWRAKLLGGSANGPFPFLLKWLDTNDTLSVQVHPTEAACAKLGRGRPKSEAWCVAYNDPKAKLFLGHYPGLDAATLNQAAKGGTVHKWMYESQPRTGDMLFVPSGTLHAIGAGFLLLEVQQPSDTTFRLFDWGRIDKNGQPRELQIDDACASVSYDRPGPQPIQRREVRGPSFMLQRLALGASVGPERLRVLAGCFGGAVVSTEAGEEELRFGEIMVAEASLGPLTVQSGACVLVSEPMPAK
jgi:mannose-6-phosphate isomerase